jgi:hypothetical protein
MPSQASEDQGAVRGFPSCMQHVGLRADKPPNVGKKIYRFVLLLLRSEVYLLSRRLAMPVL